MATVTRERPILFSGPLVRAILDGRKTQTRRPVKQVPSPEYTHLKWLEGPKKGVPRWIMEWGLSGCYTEGGRHYLDIQTEVDDNSHEEIFCPFGALGDRLWVRETWGQIDAKSNDIRDSLVYRADDNGSRTDAGMKGYWRPSIHMPRWASRLTLEIKDVRVERVQAITEADAQAEGVESVSVADVPRNACWTCRQDFAQLWDRIYAKQGLGWESNPFVWVIEFKKVE